MAPKAPKEVDSVFLEVLDAKLAAGISVEAATLTKKDKKVIKTRLEHVASTYDSRGRQRWNVPSDKDLESQYYTKFDRFCSKRFKKAKSTRGDTRSKISQDLRKEKDREKSKGRTMKRMADRDQFHLGHPDPERKFLNTKEKQAQALKLLVVKHDDLGDGESVVEYMVNAPANNRSGYIGITTEEDKRTETIRFACKSTNGILPIIHKPDGSLLEMEETGLNYIILHRDIEMENLSGIEYFMHDALMNLPVPIRMWQGRGYGPKYDGKRGNGILFFAYSTQVIPAIKAGRIVCKVLPNQLEGVEFPENFRDMITHPKLRAHLTREPLQDLDNNRPLPRRKKPIKKKSKKKTVSSSDSSSDSDSYSDSNSSSFDNKNDENDKKIQKMRLWNSNANSSFSSRHMVCADEDKQKPNPKEYPKNASTKKKTSATKRKAATSSGSRSKSMDNDVSMLFSDDEDENN